MELEQLVGTINLGSGITCNFTYFREALLNPSEELGKEIGKANHNGLRRTLGILAHKEVVWSTDPALPRHLYLAQAIGNSIRAQFQNIKIPGEYVPRVTVSANKLVDLKDLTNHILISNPHVALKISLDLIDDEIRNNNIFTGTIQQLKREIHNI